MVTREKNLHKLKEDTFDVLIIGGGATGGGLLLDAVTRGLNAALVERGDFASETSSRSTKLIHGGVRYLERAFTHLDFRQFFLVSQALKERHVLLRIAPHLTRVVPIVIPVKSWLDAAYYMPGIKIYELFAGKKRIGGSSFLRKSEVMNAFPEINPERLKGGVQLFDGQFDDARMNIALVLTAVKDGAVASNYVEIVGFEKEGGKITGAKAKDHLTGDTFLIKSKMFVNACGPFSYEIRKLDNPLVKQRVRGSVGTHILLDGKYTPFGKGILIPRTTDGRVMFLLPWKGCTLVGTTDLNTEIQSDPKPSREEILYLLGHLKDELGVEVAEEDIKACWAGIRPLVRNENVKSSEVSRGFDIIRDPSGLYSIIGGKWTAYRKMAEKCLDKMISDNEMKGILPCSTENTMLIGGEGYSQTLAESLSMEFGLDKDITLHLSQVYGDRSKEVIAVANTPELRGRLADKYPYLIGEVLYAVRNEMACTVLDILYRRTRLAALDQEAALAAIPKVIAVMAKELGWGTEAQQEQFVKARQGVKNF